MKAAIVALQAPKAAFIALDPTWEGLRGVGVRGVDAGVGLRGRIGG